MRAALRFCLMSVCLALPAGAQNLASLQEGVRIRVQPVVGHRETGNYLGVTGDSLRVFTPLSATVPLAVPMNKVKSLEVSRGQSHGRGLLKGALLGTAIGVVGGAILGAATYSHDDCDFLVCSKGSAAAFAGVGFGALGLLAGSVYGGIRGSEVWKPVPLTR